MFTSTVRDIVRKLLELVTDSKYEVCIECGTMHQAQYKPTGGITQTMVCRERDFPSYLLSRGSHVPNKKWCIERYSVRKAQLAYFISWGSHVLSMKRCTEHSSLLSTCLGACSAAQGIERCFVSRACPFASSAVPVDPMLTDWVLMRYLAWVWLSIRSDSAKD